MNQQRQGNQGNRQYDNTPRQDFFKEKFFIDDKLNPKWVAENAKTLSLGISRGTQGMTATAMRNFYNEFLRIKGIPMTRKDEKLIHVKLLKAKTNYKHKIQQATRLHPEFVKFINKLLDEVGNDLSKFDASCFIFEAIIGYADKR